MVGLDVRPFGDGEAEVAEDRRDLVDDLADRMNAAALGRRLPHRQGDVDFLGGQTRGNRRILQLRLAGGQRFRDAILQAVDRRALELTLLGGHRAKRLQHLGNGALLAEGSKAHRLDGRLIGGRGDVGQKRLFQGFKISSVGVHGEALSVGRPTPYGRRHHVSYRRQKKNPRQPCQRGFPKSEFRMLGKRWS
jgi:hypothetical protein